jgi:hypothetical protein
MAALRGAGTEFLLQIFINVADNKLGHDALMIS